jgi:hypothetical protein
MAKTKTPRTASPRNKKNGTDLPVTPVTATTAETAAAQPASLEVQVPVTPIAVAKAAEVKAVESQAAKRSSAHGCAHQSRRRDPPPCVSTL